MFKQIRKFNVVIGALFLLSFILLMFNSLHFVFNVLFALCCAVSCSMLTVALFRRYKVNSKIREQEQQVVLMEILSDTNDAIVSSINDKQVKAIKRERFSLFVPVILSGVAAILFMFSFVWLLIKII